MSTTALYREIRARMSTSRHLHSEAELLKADGKFEEFRGKMDQAMARDDEIRDWMKGILSSRVAEIF